MRDVLGIRTILLSFLSSLFQMQLLTSLHPLMLVPEIPYLVIQVNWGYSTWCEGGNSDEGVPAGISMGFNISCHFKQKFELRKEKRNVA